MKKRMNLVELNVKSFVTELEGVSVSAGDPGTIPTRQSLAVCLTESLEGWCYPWTS